MRGFENEIYRYLLFISVTCAVLHLLVTLKWPRLARLLFAVLFALASYVNWQTSQKTPQVYLTYATLTWSQSYSDFINGWFAQHIRLAVGFIAVCQSLIAIGMLFNGVVFKIAGAGAVVFLAAIIPLGVGSGFPTTLILAISMLLLLKQQRMQPIWYHKKQQHYEPA